MDIKKLLDMELFEDLDVMPTNSEGSARKIYITRVPGGWIIDGVFVPEPVKEPTIFGVPLEMSEDEKLIREHVEEAQKIIGEWGTPCPDMMSSSQKLEKDLRTLNELFEILDQEKLVEAIRRNN